MAVLREWKAKNPVEAAPRPVKVLNPKVKAPRGRKRHTPYQLAEAALARHQRKRVALPLQPAASLGTQQLNHLPASGESVPPGAATTCSTCGLVGHNRRSCRGALGPPDVVVVAGASVDGGV